MEHERLAPAASQLVQQVDHRGIVDLRTRLGQRAEAGLVDLVDPEVDAARQIEQVLEGAVLAPGRRLRLMGQEPAMSGKLVVPSGKDLEALGPVDDLKALAIGFFNRFSVEAYHVICGGAKQDDPDHKKMVEAFGLDKQTVAAFLTTLLVTNLGLAPLVATAVAALIVRLFFKPAYEEMCAFWKGKLPVIPPPGG